MARRPSSVCWKVSGSPISYPRLQEACQTDVDGTSINALEQIAVRLGLDAEQIMIPVDHLLLHSARALPALVVTCQTGNALHFLVVWRRQGPFVQVMDPAKGRRWLRTADLLAELYVHVHPVPADAWRRWAGTDECLNGLGERVSQLGISTSHRERLVAEGASDPAGGVLQPGCGDSHGGLGRPFSWTSPRR